MTPLLFLAALLSVAISQPLSRSYEHGPIPFDDNAELYFTVDRSNSTAFLAVRVFNEPLITSDDNWIGIGVSEPTSGSMLGADIVTGRFKPGKFNECILEDRHVPFVGYPLSASNGTGSVWPQLDDCQKGWTLVNCFRDPDALELILEVKRPLIATDTQDRDIPPGVNNIIYAFGQAFRHHLSGRASTRVVLYSQDGDATTVGSGIQPLPDDVDGSFEIAATNYEISTEKVTTYACTSKIFQLDPGAKKMIVAAEPVLNATNTNHVHHLIVYLCSGLQYAEKIKNTIECTSGPDISGPTGDPATGCATFLFVYAKGVSRSVLPPEAGYLMEEGNNIVVMETHYDNPNLEGNAFDNSGVRLYYTDTMRKHEAGSLHIGDRFVFLAGEKVMDDVPYQFTCSSNCTRKFARPVQLFSSFSHMHRTGREIYTNQFDSKNQFIRQFNSVNFWSDSFQFGNLLSEERTLSPGDSLQTTCRYDTSKLPNTVFGGETKDEMCLEIIGYYPVQRDLVRNKRISVCAWGNSNSLCGELNEDFNDLIVPGPNPAFEDTVDSPVSFGLKNATCKIEEDPARTPTPTGEVSVTPEIGSPSPTAQAYVLSPSESSPPIEATPSSSSRAQPSASSKNESPSPIDAVSSPSSEVKVPSPSPVVSVSTSLESATASRTPGVSLDNDNAACFPANALVNLEDGSVKRMDELAIGDKVQVSNRRYSKVFMFTHKDRDVKYRFKVITLRSGENLKLTEGHFLYLNEELKMARECNVGDRVKLGNGNVGIVSETGENWDSGLYNPQTDHGDIVVDGIVSSTYTDMVKPVLAHSILAPIRWLYQVCSIDCSGLITSFQVKNR